MTDIFISYAREDNEIAGRLANAFNALGWSVWWDRNILTGQALDQAIERELETAKSVVVLWSKHSIESEWVKNEAAAAAERGVWAPATIETVKLPLEFRRKQTADLSGWNGDALHGGFQALCEGVAHLIGSQVQPQEPALAIRGHKRWAAAIATLLIVIVFGLGAYWLSSRRKEPMEVGGLADLVSGTYQGDVIADAKGYAQSDISVSVRKIERNKVRVTSDYGRLGTVDVRLTRATDSDVLNADGDAVFHVYLNRDPRALDLIVHNNEVNYRGTATPKPNKISHNAGR